jgi:hypothetical protein
VNRWVNHSDPDVWGRDIPPDGLEVSYAFVMPDVAPRGLRDASAGVIRRGLFYPHGSVARGFFDQHQAAQRATARVAPIHVYFIECSVTGRIKIGCSKNVDGRVKNIQQSYPHPLRLRHVIHDGGRRLETRLHRRFTEHRVWHEWFLPAPEIMEIIENG